MAASRSLLVDWTVYYRREDAALRPFTMWGETRDLHHRICSCHGPKAECSSISKPLILLVEDPHARIDRSDLVDGVRCRHPDVLVVPVAEIHALSASRKPAYAEDEAMVKLRHEDAIQNGGCLRFETAIPDNDARARADGLAIVASALALTERYVASARRCRKSRYRTSLALHALESLEGARAVHAMFKLGTGAVVPAYTTMAPDLWSPMILFHYKWLANQTADPPHEPSADEIEALYTLIC